MPVYTGPKRGVIRSGGCCWLWWGGGGPQARSCEVTRARVGLGLRQTCCQTSQWSRTLIQSIYTEASTEKLR
jgi:hypothetical protein